MGAERLGKAVKKNRTVARLALHREIWFREQERLSHLSTVSEKSAHESLCTFVAQCNPLNEDEKNTLDKVADILDEVEGAEAEREEFMTEVSDRVSSVRHYMHRVRSSTGRKESVESMRQDCLESLAETKAYLRPIYEELAEQASSISQSMVHFRRMQNEMDQPEGDDPWIVHEGKVMKFTDLPCVDENIKASCVEQHNRLITAYKDRVSALSTAHPPLSDCTLSDETRFKLRKVYDEYESAEQHKWTSCLDRVHLEMPRLPKSDISRYLRWYTTHTTHTTQFSILQQLHAREMADFIARTISRFAAAEVDHWRELRAKQEASCREEQRAEMHEKLGLWKEGVEEERCRKEAEEERSRVVEEEERRAHEEKMQAQREMHQKMIKEYQVAKQAQVMDQMLTGIEMRKAYEEESIERMKYNRTRIHHRTTLLDQKKLDHEADIARQHEAKAALERRLERLRATVAVSASRDWERTCGDTEAFRRFRDAEKDTPFYRVDGYTVDKMLADKRLKLSVALADSGLLHNSYARELLTSMTGSHAPRRDHLSAIRLG
ncbi:uncharacterized protein EV422DRAFT_520249 [Fimicolochytrium jonesii]|uniref:uncharacterized protein n=1 Tax=Fimicolochytrium jonesii TaxID=1396493 RepID=UPI0022FF29D0|nr:uncharacterized protein EV422DRAFT_520249 [Fimicolochytrium jonesii]KAI8824480.1 hypothetical protein EV422DRAFT_520249 [Fimicolochytrium jonesii]